LHDSESPQPMESWSSNDILSWMAESLYFFMAVWNHRSFAAWRRQWTSNELGVECLLAAVVDVLEHVIVPNHELYTHPVTLEYIAWLQTLLRQQQSDIRAEDDDSPRPPNFGFLLLRTRQTTCESTAQKWHFAPTAVAVAISLLHKIVVRQSLDDHLPASPSALAAPALSPLRDHLVRFFHGLYLAVQNERRNQSTLTLTTVLSERIELFKAAAARILSIPPDSHYPGKAHSDIRTMLQIQMEELADDRAEMLAP
jgi:hypothetical protein